jgi:adenylyl cyclase-associated protein
MPIPHPFAISFVAVAGEAPAVKAYDAYVKSAVVPLAQTCDDLGGLKNMGQLLQDAWEGVRVVVVLASRSKAPTDDLATALGPHLAATQNAVKSIRNLRLDREWDCHYKAIVELLACLSWILYRAPQALPAGCVKEALGSAEFWSNRIRKDYKGKDDQQIAFCDNLKKAIAELVDYINEYHKTGLTWNPRGISLVEAAIRLSDDPIEQPDPKSPLQKRHPTLGAVAGGGNLLGLMGELNKRKNSDGSSAATGLKHVSHFDPPESPCSAQNLTNTDLSTVHCRFRKINKLGVRNTKSHPKMVACRRFRIWRDPNRWHSRKRRPHSKVCQFLSTRTEDLNGWSKITPRSLSFGRRPRTAF